MQERLKVIYLDVCALCRPFDDQSQMKIKLETDCIFIILEKIKSGQYKMLFSKIHNFEIGEIEEKEEREELLQFLKKYGNEEKNISKEWINTRILELERIGFGLGDSAHLTFAENQADYFISVDSNLLKKYQKTAKGKCLQ
jgi:Mg2+ and Co2+ transporter CorA